MAKKLFILFMILSLIAPYGTRAESFLGNLDKLNTIESWKKGIIGFFEYRIGLFWPEFEKEKIEMIDDFKNKAPVFVKFLQDDWGHIDGVVNYFKNLFKK